MIKQGISRIYGIKTFNLSNDPRSIEKVRDVAGIYLDQPDKTLVSFADGKSQIRAADRIQPGLPSKKGRSGTICTERVDGKVIGACMPKYRQEECLKFLEKIDAETSFRY